MFSGGVAGHGSPQCLWTCLCGTLRQQAVQGGSRVVDAGAMCSFEESELISPLLGSASLFVCPCPTQVDVQSLVGRVNRWVSQSGAGLAVLYTGLPLGHAEHYCVAVCFHLRRPVVASQVAALLQEAVGVKTWNLSWWEFPSFGLGTGPELWLHSTARLLAPAQVRLVLGPNGLESSADLSLFGEVPVPVLPPAPSRGWS